METIDLLHINGKPNPPGLATLHGYADLADIDTVVVPASTLPTGTTAAGVATIATAHTFATGKCMSKLYGTQNKGKGGYAPVGEVDSEAQKGTSELYHPGSKAEADAMALLFTNWSGLVWIAEADGTVRQYGSEAFPARLKVTYDTGNNEGYKGYKIDVQAYGLPFIYTAGLNFTPAP